MFFLLWCGMNCESREIKCKHNTCIYIIYIIALRYRCYLSINTGLIMASATLHILSVYIYTYILICNYWICHVVNAIYVNMFMIDGNSKEKTYVWIVLISLLSKYAQCQESLLSTPCLNKPSCHNQLCLYNWLWQRARSSIIFI